ncbi:hypothetical protein [Brevundimonas denitrificans]|uniref:hypothetical protein n=1 Tax=Brevundimonas denitrificans TaxID=1443434 RepID=UPI00352D9E7E
MRPTALVCAAAVAALVLPAVAAAQQQPFTYEHMLNANRLSDPRVSPDGSQVVYALRATPLAGGSTSLYILDLDGEAEPRRLPIPTRAPTPPAGAPTASCSSCPAARARRRSGAPTPTEASRSRSQTCPWTSRPIASAPRATASPWPPPSSPTARTWPAPPPAWTRSRTTPEPSTPSCSCATGTSGATARATTSSCWT